MWSGVGLRVGGVLFGLVLLVLALGSMLPGGRQIAFASALDGDLDIYLLDMARGMTFNLTRTPDNETQPQWSPDGSQMVFVSEPDGNNDLYILQVNCPSFFSACTVPIRRLTDEAGTDFFPSWSPDGTQIAFTSERFGQYEILTVNAGGGIPRRLTHNDRVDTNPSWSPDGTQIAFASDRDRQWDVDLYLMDADGSNARRLLDNPTNTFSPTWSPDGRRLAFGNSGTANGQLAILDLDSGQITLLLDDKGYDDTPAWSPDGESLALAAFRNGDYDLFLLPLDCTGTPTDCLQRLTFNPALDTMPVWRP